jgi:hypothetical protein
MLLIGESLNVINRVIGKAFKEKDPGPIAEEAKKQRRREWTGSTSIWGRPEKVVLS